MGKWSAAKKKRMRLLRADIAKRVAEMKPLIDIILGYWNENFISDRIFPNHNKHPRCGKELSHVR
jgi:hypothetical protein